MPSDEIGAKRERLIGAPDSTPARRFVSAGPQPSSPRPARRTPRDRHPLLRYGLAIATVSILTILRLELVLTIGDKSPYIIYLPAVMLASWYGGLGPGCTAIALGGLCGFYFFTNPPWSLVLGEPNDLVVLALFLSAGLMLVLVHDAQRKANARAEEHALAAHQQAELLVREAEQRELATAELRTANTRFRMATEAISGLVFEYDVASDEIYCSKGAPNMLGTTIETSPHNLETWFSRICDDDREAVENTLRSALACGQSYSVEYRVPGNGEVRTVWERGLVERGPDGRAMRIVGYLMDISEQKLAEAERARHLAEIEDLNTRLRRAMTETDHRVKNNLQVISALVDIQVMQADGSIPASELGRLVGHIRAIAMIHDFLAQGWNLGAQVQEVSAHKALDKLVPLLQHIAEGRNIQVHIEDAPLSVRQATALLILVQELVSNAVKHGRGEIDLQFRVANGFAVIAVTDDGPGFPPDFDPRSASNTGLDLIDSLGRWDLQGRVAFENRPEGGGRAFVSFPLAHQAAVRSILEPQPSQ